MFEKIGDTKHGRERGGEGEGKEGTVHGKNGFVE